MAKVLILDRSKSVRNVLRERLEYEGFSAEAAEDEAEASALCGKIPFDVIISDTACGMPRTGAPVIALSSDPSIDTALAAVRDGARDFLPKPVDMNRLMESLHRVLEQPAPASEPAPAAHRCRRAHPAQAKVLRALQENRISRVGGDKEIEVDVRVIAATNKDLREEIRRGNFREDLYHRLAVIVVRVPALREHPEDIPTLVDHFIRTLADEYRKPPKPITEEAVALLREKPWTGNIRELRNVVERLLILSGEQITADDVRLYC